MRFSMKMALLPVLGLLLASWLAGCDLLGGGESWPEGPVIVAAVDGNEPGLWLFDPETLERRAVAEAVQGHAPKGMAFSPGYERWYLAWSIGSQLDGTAQNVLAVLDPESGRIIERTATSNLSVGGSPLVYEPTKDQVIAYGSGLGAPVQFYDAETLELVHKQPIGGEDSYVVAAAVADEREEVYFGAATREPAQIYVYDAIEQAITSAFALTDDPVLRRSVLSDVALSPDERYLYATTFLSPGGPGRFYMVDLQAGETVFAGRAGGYSNLAVSPNGRFVYIDCPAGGFIGLIPTGQVLRFDTEARKMEVFIGGAEGMGLQSNAILVADHITMLPGSETLVMTIPGAMKTTEGKDVHLVRVDAETGQALTTYALARDDRGYITARFRFLKFVIIPR